MHRNNRQLVEFIVIIFFEYDVTPTQLHSLRPDNMPLFSRQLIV